MGHTCHFPNFDLQNKTQGPSTRLGLAAPALRLGRDDKMRGAGDRGWGWRGGERELSKTRSRARDDARFSISPFAALLS